jgi:hypothetical protein
MTDIAKILLKAQMVARLLQDAAPILVSAAQQIQLVVNKDLVDNNLSPISEEALIAALVSAVSSALHLTAE